jgi:hypothetical protein
MRVWLSTGVLAALALALGACGGKPSAVAPAGPVAAGADVPFGAPQGADAREAPVPLVGGKPMWAANRRHSAQENAQYQFAKNGRDFGAASETDYVTKVHDFIEHPPTGIETLDRRNGDKLLYDARANVFAVVSKDGAPRTMFKPRAGAAYWDEQKQRQAQQGQRQTRRGQDASDEG